MYAFASSNTLSVKLKPINPWHTLVSYTFSTSSKETTCTLFAKHRGCTLLLPNLELIERLQHLGPHQVFSLLPPLRPPAATRSLRIQLEPRESPASRATGTRWCG